MFHDSVRLSLALSSPHFKSKKTTETFSVLVMTSKSDKSKSFAIDEFPEMDPLAVEEFWVKKAKTKKAQRQEVGLCEERSDELRRRKYSHRFAPRIPPSSITPCQLFRCF